MRIRHVVPLITLAAAVGLGQSIQPPNSAPAQTTTTTPPSVLQSQSQIGLTSYSEQTARTMPRALDQLAEESVTIVHGFVISAVVEPHPQLKNLLTVLVTMKVESTLKGAPQKTFQFRQYIWDARDRAGSAGYLKGEELLLLLGPVSQYGLRSPVGLEQGRFRILRDNKGNAVALNGRGNMGLFQSVEERARTKGIQLSPKTTALIRTKVAGAVPLDDLKDALITLGRTK